MPSTSDFERDQARQEAFANDQERIDRFTDRAANSVHLPGMVERLRKSAGQGWAGTSEDRATLDAADLFEEIREHLSNERFRLVEEEHDFVGAQAVRNVLSWLDRKLEGK